MGGRLTVIQPGDGRRVQLGSNTTVLKLLSGDTGGGYSVAEFIVAPAARTVAPPHHHPHDEMYFVIEGTMTFDIAGETYEAPPGTFIHIPGGVVHHPVNNGTETVRMLLLFAPGGFEGYFEEVDSLLPPLPPGQQRDLSIIGHVAEKYGMNFERKT